MPWNEPGKGDKDPWKSNGQQPPDLEEIFSNVSKRLQSLFGGGGGQKRDGDSAGGRGGGGAFSLVVLLIIVWVAWDSVHIIEEAEQGVVLRFGKYARTLDPGFNLTLPRPIEVLEKVNISNVRVVEDRGHMLTEDENLVDLNFSVQYRVSSAEDFLFKVREPEDTLHEAMESALRESVGTNNLDFILGGEGRLKVGIDTEKVLQETLDRYNSGIQITKFNLKDATVPAQVRDAFADVNKAREDRQRFIEEAQVHVNSVIPEARGAAARIIQEAVGYRDSTIALAEGEADRFSLLMAEYQMAPAITRKRLYLQTMENVLSRSNKVLLDVDSSGNVLYLPLGGDAGRGASALMPPLVTPNNSNSPQQERASGSSRNAARESRR